MAEPFDGTRRPAGGRTLAVAPVASAYRREDRGANLQAATPHRVRAGVGVGALRGAGLDGSGGSSVGTRPGWPRSPHDPSDYW